MCVSQTLNCWSAGLQLVPGHGVPWCGSQPGGWVPSFALDFHHHCGVALYLDSRLCPSWLDAEGIGLTLASPSCERSPDLTAPQWLGAHGWLQSFSCLGQPQHTAVLWWEHETRRSCTELSRICAQGNEVFVQGRRKKKIQKHNQSHLLLSH